jgi:lipoate-protein ligase B
VWVGDKKIASMGIGVHKWVTMHGLGLNINTDLSYFEILRPCGMDIKMTSMSEILGESVDMGLVKEELVKQVLIGFGNKFSYSGGVKVRS